MGPKDLKKELTASALLKNNPILLLQVNLINTFISKEILIF